MIEKNFRPITADELALLRRLCELNFEGREEVLRQLVGLEARQTDDHGALGCLELRVKSAGQFPLRYGPIVEGHYSDIPEPGRAYPGHRIELLLFVNDGKLECLEVVNNGDDPITRRPTLEELWLFSAYEIDRDW